MKRKLARYLKYSVLIFACVVFISILRKLFFIVDQPLQFEQRAFMPQYQAKSLSERIVKPQKEPFLNKKVRKFHNNSRTTTPRRQKKTTDADLIDWHDYKKIKEDAKRTGPGEQGAAYELNARYEADRKKIYRLNGYNGLASDHISLHRALKDLRHHQCKKKKYLRKLLQASIVIPFHNEHWTTVLRNVHSIIDRSPPELLKEIILSDDFSTKEFLKSQLDEYVAREFTNVKVVRAEKREGLIRTRILGAKAATGDVLIFLDAHCEVTNNWLPPLLDPITRDKKTVVCPFIDVINSENFAYTIQDNGARGAFDWELYYKRLPLLPKDLKRPAEPFDSPIMAGGLFAISREWFWDLGGYDPGLDIWGGEQYELSFKIWQCGGRMVDAPCSRVGHVYRKFAPFPNPGVGDFMGRNYRRVAVVWMDEYAEYLYKRRPSYRRIDPGNLTEQFAIRKKHNCKPFSWFIENIAFDLVKMYPPIEPAPFAEGEIRNGASNLCIDTKFSADKALGLNKCTKDSREHGGEQYFELTFHMDIRPKKRKYCFDVSQSIRKSPVILFSCHGMKGNQWFKYNLDTKQLFHPVSNYCLDTDKDRTDVFMEPCDPAIPTQQWLIEKINNLEELRKNFNIQIGEE